MRVKIGDASIKNSACVKTLVASVSLPLTVSCLFSPHQVVVGTGCLTLVPFSLKYEGDFDCLTVQIMTGAIIGGVVLLLVIVVACCCCCKKRREEEERARTIPSAYPGYNEVRREGREGRGERESEREREREIEREIERER